jgi:hypothetical protein
MRDPHVVALHYRLETGPRKGEHMRLATLALLLMFFGCTHYNYPFSVDALKEQGYKDSKISYVSTSGERRVNENYQVWWKEIQEGGRRVHLCVVPVRSYAGYAWRATVFVDDKEQWSYDSGPGSGKPSNLLQGVSCATSGPLPDGRITWRTWYSYWQ